MLLKRNLFAILYSVLFIILMSISFAALTCLLLMDKTDRNMYACILVFGMIVYLLIAFFIKQKKWLTAVQDSGAVYIILEITLALCTIGGLLYLNINKGITSTVVILTTFLITYAISRLLGGRLCGLFGMGISFLFFAGSYGSAFVQGEYTDCLCFLVPYLFFLFITNVLTRLFQKSGFLIFSSYLLLAVIFAFAIIMNPHVCILLVGCVFSLIFGKSEKTTGFFSSGPVLAGELLFFTVLFFFAAVYFVENLFIVPEYLPDDTLLSCHTFAETAAYLFEKTKKCVVDFYRPFGSGIIPCVLSFMAMTSGYYCIRKKSSGIGPLCFSFVILMCIHALYGKEGTPFYYLTYFIPVFAAYGFTNTLLPEKSSIYTPELQIEETEDETAEPPKKTAQPEEETKMESLSQELLAEEEENMDKQLEEIPEWTVSDEFIQTQDKEPEAPIEDFAQDKEEPEALVEDFTQNKEQTEVMVESFTQEEPETLDPKEEDELHSLLNRLELSENIKRMNESAQEDIADVIEREDEQMELSTAIPTADIPDITTVDVPDVHELPKYEKPDFHLEPIEQPLTNSYSEISEYDKVPTINDLEKKWRKIKEQENVQTEDSEMKLEPKLDGYEIDTSEIDINGINTNKDNTSEVDANEAAANGFAYSLEDILGTGMTSKAEEPEIALEPETEEEPEIVLESETQEEPQIMETASAEEPIIHKQMVIHTEEVIKKTGLGKRAYHRITFQ